MQENVDKVNLQQQRYGILCGDRSFYLNNQHESLLEQVDVVQDQEYSTDESQCRQMLRGQEVLPEVNEDQHQSLEVRVALSLLELEKVR